jgi:hypothetical protein
VYFLQLMAGEDPQIVISGTNVITTFQARAGYFVSLETSETLSGTNAWQTVWGVAAGDDRLHAVTNTLTGTPRRFFRVRQVEP